MSHWDRTYQRTEISVGDLSPVAQVFSAITDNGELYGNLSISIRQPHGNAEANICLTAYQMRDLAMVLRKHADRLDEFKNELDHLQTVAA